MEAQKQKEPMSKAKKVFLMVGGAIVALMVIGSLSSDEPSQQPAEQQTPKQETVVEKPAEVPQEPQVSKEEAQNQLVELMELSKAAKIVTSYEFSEKAVVVYVDKAWYEQPATFKKDFLARVASLKKITTGYKHFEIRDTYSDEKVAEVTSFTGSLEVYK